MLSDDTKHTRRAVKHPVLAGACQGGSAGRSFHHGRLVRSGNLAMLAAMRRRASSRVNNLPPLADPAQPRNKKYASACPLCPVR